MTTKQFRLRTFVLGPNKNKSLPIGTIAAVKEYLEKLGFDTFFDGIKERGERMFPLVCALISYRLTENFSVEGCGRWLESREVRNELGVRKEISHRMLNRATERIGENMPEVRRTSGVLYCPCMISPSPLPRQTDNDTKTSQKSNADQRMLFCQFPSNSEYGVELRFKNKVRNGGETHS